MLTRDWHKSSYSGHEGACVEARLLDTAVEVRDTKDRGGPTLLVALAEWHRLLTNVAAE